LEGGSPDPKDPPLDPPLAYTVRIIFPCILSGFLSLHHKMTRHAVSDPVNTQNIGKVTQVLGSTLTTTAWMGVCLTTVAPKAITTPQG